MAEYREGEFNEEFDEFEDEGSYAGSDDDEELIILDDDEEEQDDHTDSASKSHSEISSGKGTSSHPAPKPVNPFRATGPGLMCFNCDGDHNVVNCKEKLDKARIEANKRKYANTPKIVVCYNCEGNHYVAECPNRRDEKRIYQNKRRHTKSLKNNQYLKQKLADRVQTKRSDGSFRPKFTVNERTLYNERRNLEAVEHLKAMMAASRPDESEQNDIDTMGKRRRKRLRRQMEAAKVNKGPTPTKIIKRDELSIPQSPSLNTAPPPKKISTAAWCNFGPGRDFENSRWYCSSAPWAKQYRSYVRITKEKVFKNIFKDYVLLPPWDKETSKEITNSEPSTQDSEEITPLESSSELSTKTSEQIPTSEPVTQVSVLTSESSEQISEEIPTSGQPSAQLSDETPIKISDEMTSEPSKE